MQSLIRAIYPPQCVACDTPAEAENGLCAACWRETDFISGAICDSCGTPMLGADSGEMLQCDDCMKIARPWDQGRAVFAYNGVGRKIVLAFKHSDRTELAVPAGAWLARAAVGLITPQTIVVPVPLHWRRMLSRRYNQAALLAASLARTTKTTCCPDALTRTRRTAPLEGHSRDARFAALTDAIALHPRRKHLLQGRPVIVVDDVMTSGATLAACAEALLAAGAEQVCVAVLARAVKDA